MSTVTAFGKVENAWDGFSTCWWQTTGLWSTTLVATLMGHWLTWRSLSVVCKVDSMGDQTSMSCRLSTKQHCYRTPAGIYTLPRRCTLAHKKAPTNCSICTCPLPGIAWYGRQQQWTQTVSAQPTKHKTVHVHVHMYPLPAFCTAARQKTTPTPPPAHSTAPLPPSQCLARIAAGFTKEGCNHLHAIICMQPWAGMTSHPPFSRFPALTFSFLFLSSFCVPFSVQTTLHTGFTQSPQPHARCTAVQGHT